MRADRPQEPGLHKGEVVEFVNDPKLATLSADVTVDPKLAVDYTPDIVTKNFSDLLSYGPQRWSSDYAYDGLFTVLAEGAKPSALRQAAPPRALGALPMDLSAGGAQVLLSGVITPTAGTGEFGYACTLGLILFVFVLGLTIIYQKYVKVDK